MSTNTKTGATAAAAATASTIEAVSALLARPENWCQKASARDAAGQPVPAESPQACSWCLRGAIARVGGGEQGSELGLTDTAGAAIASREHNLGVIPGRRRRTRNPDTPTVPCRARAAALDSGFRYAAPE